MHSFLLRRRLAAREHKEHKENVSAPKSFEAGGFFAISAILRRKFSAPHFQAQNLARLAFCEHLKRPTTNFAIGRKALFGDRGVNGQLKRLAAKRALDRFGDLHEYVILGRLSL